MPSDFLNIETNFPNFRDGESAEQMQVKMLNYMRQLVEQLRYNFRHLKIPELSAGQITSGVLPVLRGGTGHAGTGTITRITSVAEAGTDCTITAAQLAYWGKTAQLRIAVTKEAAVTSGNTVIATLNEGVRPKYQAAAVWPGHSGNTAYVNANGNVVVNGPITAGASLVVLATYILA